MKFNKVAIVLCASLLSSYTFAERLMVTGTVTNVIPNYKTISTQHPRQECRIVEVPVTSQRDNGDNLGAFVIGAIVGSAIGNAATEGNGAGTAGAILGGAIANEHQKKHNSREVVEYRRVNQCSTVYDTEERVVVGSYTVQYQALGQNLSTVSNQGYVIGQTIDVFVDFNLKYN